MKARSNIASGPVFTLCLADQVRTQCDTSGPRRSRSLSHLLGKLARSTYRRSATSGLAELLIKVKAQAYSVEAGNVRHEHEWKVWKDVERPDGKVLMPGVVGHATNLVEHPEVVADRSSLAHTVGRENVIAGTDCGLGRRVHPQLAWAKLGALAEGASGRPTLGLILPIPGVLPAARRRATARDRSTTNASG